MKSELDEVAYRLIWDYEHFRELGLDWNEDISIRKYEGYKSYEFYQTEAFEHPSPLVYEGYLDVVEHIDYPQPDNHWTIMSERMRQTLLAVGDFLHRAIPVVIVTTDAVNLPKQAGKSIGNYFAVQLTSRLDVFDYEKSRYDRDEDESDRLDIKEYVFKIPPQGLPPIFRIPEELTALFVSADARRALKDAKITGPRYISLKGHQGEEQREWVDTKIVLPAEIYQ